MSILQHRASRVVQIIESGLSQDFFNESDEQDAYREIQQMIWDLGGRNLSPKTSLAGATNYLLGLWLAKGTP